LPYKLNLAMFDAVLYVGLGAQQSSLARSLLPLQWM